MLSRLDKNSGFRKFLGLFRGAETHVRSSEAAAMEDFDFWKHRRWEDIQVQLNDLLCSSSVDDLVASYATALSASVEALLRNRLFSDIPEALMDSAEELLLQASLCAAHTPQSAVEPLGQVTLGEEDMRKLDDYPNYANAA
jgi:hypothetical protein